MINNPLISIIMPVYNGQDFIFRCVDSIINQTYENLEIVLVDDGSTDNSGSILDKYKEKDKRIKVIHQQNKGLSGARNSGIKNSTGNYIMFVDCDDWIDYDCVSSAVSEIIKNNADCVFWSYVREFEDKSQVKKIFDQDKIIYDDIKNTLYIRQIGLLADELKNPENIDSLNTVCTKIYDLNIIRNNNIEFVDINKIGPEDCYFNICYFAYSKKAVYINKYFYHYLRTSDDTITKKYRHGLIQRWEYLFSVIQNNINNTNPSDKAYKALDNRIALSIIGLGLNICRSDKSIFSKTKEINEIISLNIYRNAYQNLTLKYFPMHWKLFFFCAKARLSFFVYILLMMIKKIIGR